ncbi:MAG: hypothetical protein ABSB63_00645 [Spirochaetia bacterium]|jgi:hypothetical protein
MKRLFLLSCLLPVVILGCVSSGDSFLVQKLDDQSKSRALTIAGAEEYDLHVVRRQEFDQIPRIKDYFTVALSFDPTNAQAQQYITLIDNYKKRLLQANLKDANRNLAKPKRTDDDNYALFVSLQTAARIDPTDPNVRKLLGDTSQDRAKLVDVYLGRAKAALAKVDSKTPDAAREKQYTEAFQNANKAVAVDPRSSAAQGMLASTKDELAKSVARRVASLQKLVIAGNYADGRTQLAALNDLNRKLDNDFEADVKKVAYELNFAWAKSLYAKKDYATAEARTDAALAVSRTEEASSLKRKLADIRAKADSGASFDTTLQDIDQLIGAGDLVAAHRKIDALWKVTNDQSKQQMLDDRNQKIVSSLKDLYDRGVQAYRDEDFKTAIDLLQTVVGVQVDYEQAGDYLDRARAKQKLVDQY